MRRTWVVTSGRRSRNRRIARVTVASPMKKPTVSVGRAPEKEADGQRGARLGRLAHAATGGVAGGEERPRLVDELAPGARERDGAAPAPETRARPHPPHLLG